MSEINNLNTADDIEDHVAAKRPDESSGLLIEAMLKISNPETGEVIVEGRA